MHLKFFFLPFKLLMLFVNLHKQKQNSEETHEKARYQHYQATVSELERIIPAKMCVSLILAVAASLVDTVSQVGPSREEVHPISCLNLNVPSVLFEALILALTLSAVFRFENIGFSLEI